MTTELETIQRAIDENQHEQLERLFCSDKSLISTIDGAEFKDGKRRMRTKPKCNLAASKMPWRNVTILRERDDRLFYDMAAHAVGYKHNALSAVISRIVLNRLHTGAPVGLDDTASEALSNRVTIAQYDAKFPETENPEHKLWPRDPRNASPTKPKDAGQLNAFWDYRELNKSAESLQTNYLQADNDNFDDSEWEEGDLKTPQRDAESELETRPNDTELLNRCSAPTVQYETRQVGLITGPKLSDCGYCMAPTSPLIREIKFPIGGEVLCIGFHKDRLLEYEDSARNALPTFGIKVTPKQIGAYVERIAKPQLLNICDVAKDKKWVLYQVGGLRFAPYRTKNHYRGQLTHYRAADKHNDRWFRAKEDEYGTPYGPESKGSNPVYWKPLSPRVSKSKVASLSSGARAKQLSNKPKHLPCALPTDDMFEAFRLKLLHNGDPANSIRQPDGLPYDVESADELQFGYAFGKTCHDTSDSEPSDEDMVERSQTLVALNARLSPQARLVANMVVLTDETETAAQNYLDVGAALTTGRKEVSERSLMRHGQTAVRDAAKEINSIRQELAA
jgi:hypothetical protein